MESQINLHLIIVGINLIVGACNMLLNLMATELVITTDSIVDNLLNCSILSNFNQNITCWLYKFVFREEDEVSEHSLHSCSNPENVQMSNDNNLSESGNEGLVSPFM